MFCFVDDPRPRTLCIAVYIHGSIDGAPEGVARLLI